MSIPTAHPEEPWHIANGKSSPRPMAKHSQSLTFIRFTSIYNFPNATCLSVVFRCWNSFIHLPALTDPLWREDLFHSSLSLDHRPHPNRLNPFVFEDRPACGPLCPAQSVVALGWNMLLPRSPWRLSFKFLGSLQFQSL